MNRFEQLWWRVVWALGFCVALAFLSWGCRTVESKTDDLAYGMSYEEVAWELGDKGKLHFAALDDNEVVKGYGMSPIRPWYVYHSFFVFRDDRLSSIVRFRDVIDWEVIELANGAKFERQAAWNAEARLRRILATEPMSIAAYQDAVREHHAARRNRSRSYHQMPLLILLPIGIPSMVAFKVNETQLERAYNAERVDIGMSSGEVDSEYGMPIFVKREGERESRVYGPSGEFRVGHGRVVMRQGNEHTYVAVVFEGDRAVRIFSGDLFDADDLVSDENRVGTDEQVEPLDRNDSE